MSIHIEASENALHLHFDSVFKVLVMIIEIILPVFVAWFVMIVNLEICI